MKPLTTLQLKKLTGAPDREIVPTLRDLEKRGIVTAVSWSDHHPIQWVLTAEWKRGKYDA